MAEQFASINDDHIEFINKQHLFFVGSAAAEGLINVSPKGMDTLRVLGPNKVVWLNLTGSGNETSAHVQQSRRMTVMFCSFDKQPLIMRLYGEAEVIHPRDKGWQELIQLFPAYPGARQIFEVDVRLVQTSCGYAVPYYEPKGERATLSKWSEKKGQKGIADYWEEENQVSLDGWPTHITLKASRK